MKWPRHYRIGYRTMRLKPWSRPQSRMQDLDGHTNMTWGETRFCPDFDLEEQAHIILHETLHNMLTMANFLQGTDNHETLEETCQVVSNGLCDLARQNPKLWRKLSKALRTERKKKGRTT